MIIVVESTSVAEFVEARSGFTELAGSLSRMPGAKPARSLPRKNTDAAAPWPTSTARKTQCQRNPWPGASLTQDVVSNRHCSRRITVKRSNVTDQSSPIKRLQRNQKTHRALYALSPLPGQDKEDRQLEDTPLRDRGDGLGCHHQASQSGLSQRPAIVRSGSPIAEDSEDPSCAKCTIFTSRASQRTRLPENSPLRDRSGGPILSTPDRSARPVGAAR